MRRLKLLLALYSLAATLFAHAAGNGLNSTALKEIEGFAFRVCDAGSSTKNQTSEARRTEVNAEIDAQLPLLYKRLASLGVKGAVESDVIRTKSVLQKDLAGLITTEIECRKDLVKELLQQLKSTSTPQAAPEKSADVCGLMGNPKLCIGMNRKVFADAMLGRAIKWETKNTLLQASLPGALYSFTGQEIYSFENDVLISSQFEAESEHSIGTDYENRGSYEKPLWLDTTDFNKGSRNAVDKVCKQARELTSTLIGQYGAPIDGPTKSIEDLSSKIIEYRTCRDKCNIGSSTATAWNTRFRLAPRVFLDHHIRSKDLAWEGINDVRSRKYDRELYACYLNVDIHQL